MPCCRNGIVPSIPLARDGLNRLEGLHFGQIDRLEVNDFRGGREALMGIFPIQLRADHPERLGCQFIDQRVQIRDQGYSFPMLL